jgi:hypothetical protein
LDLEFSYVVSAVAARVEPISVGELYTQLVSFEKRMELHGGGYQSSANMATKGCRSGNNSNPRGRGAGHGSGRGQRRGRDGGRSQGGAPSGVICQLCGKDDHTVFRRYKRFDASFTGPPQKTSSFATTSYGVDTN